MLATRATATFLSLLAIALGPGAAASEAYLIGPQDKIAVRVYEWRATTGEPFAWEALNGEFVVDASGRVSLPLVGTVMVAGETPAATSEIIAGRLQEAVGLLKPPSASVQVVEFRPIYIVGSIDKPGEYPFRPGLTVLQAVSIAGGMRRTPDALYSRLERDAINSRGDMRVISMALQGLVAKRARLQAELDGSGAIAFPQDLLDQKSDPAIDTALREEELIFSSRRENVEKRVEANERLKSLLSDQIASLRSQVELKSKQIASVQRELANVTRLVEKGFGTTPRQLAMERSLAEYESRQLDLERAIVDAQVEISQAERNSIELRSRLRDDAALEMRQAQSKLEELREKFETARYLVQEAEVIAPSNFARVARQRSSSEPSYSLVRNRDGESEEIAATEASLVQPGDTVRVEVPLPEVLTTGTELGSSGPRTVLLPSQ